MVFVVKGQQRNFEHLHYFSFPRTCFDSRNFVLGLTTMALEGFHHKCLDFEATIATAMTELASELPA
jgi:hypothetical protein